MNMKKIIGIFIVMLLIASASLSVSGKTTLYADKNNYNQTILANEKGNIMVTGFWNPTGQMIKPFSTNSFLNPEGWKGENWENFGYNIYS